MTSLSDLIFYKTGAMSFHDKPIPHETLREILKAATSCAWLGRWRMLSVTEREKRVRVVEAWQDALTKMGRQKDVEFIERWKVAPLFIAFCQPKNFEPYTWVPAEHARTYSIQEVGGAVRSLELRALELGIFLHGIMGLLIPQVSEGVKAVLGIAESQELIFFGILGYPDEMAEGKFPKLEDVCYSEKWPGKSLGSPVQQS